MRRKIANAAAFGPADRNAETGDGRALVDVGRPDLKRRAGNFEAEPHEHQRGGDAEQRRWECSPASSCG